MFGYREAKPKILRIHVLSTYMYASGRIIIERGPVNLHTKGSTQTQNLISFAKYYSQTEEVLVRDR